MIGAGYHVFPGFNPRARAGRDISISARALWAFGFNPRARAGRDHDHLRRCGYEAVSIHAPARGATLSIPMFQIKFQCFNPRARAGRDLVLF